VLAGYTQLRLARAIAPDHRLPWERPHLLAGSLLVGSAVGFRSCCSRSARQSARRNPMGAPQGAHTAAAPVPPLTIQRSRRPPDTSNRHDNGHRSIGGRPNAPAGLNRTVRAYCRTAQKYGIILIDTSPVHALTIYQEDVKDNLPASGNPFAGGYWGTDANWPSLASVPLDQFRVVAPF
jgi:hypothetical protein